MQLGSLDLLDVECWIWKGLLEILMKLSDTISCLLIFGNIQALFNAPNSYQCLMVKIITRHWKSDEDEVVATSL
jgi:hypothetical protein